MRISIKYLLCAILFVFFSFFASINSNIYASPYGEGSYGEGGFGARTLTPAGPPICSDQEPGSAPWLYSATPKSTGSILLQFTESSDPVDKYVLEFGTESDNYSYGADNIGGKGTKSYVVDLLSPNTTYFFRVRAGNGCATGPWSNEISATTKKKYFLDVETGLDTEIVDVELLKKEEEGMCKTYTVKSGDTLAKIARELLGDESKYIEVIALSKKDYPSLETEPSAIKVGWVLTVSCPEEEEGEPEKIGYDVKIKVVDTDKKAVKGAKVMLFSTPREAITDKDGVALFKNVEPGEHRVVISYKWQTGEQKINLQENMEVDEIDFTIQIQSTNPFFNPWVIGVLTVLMLTLVGVTLRAKRRAN